MKKISGKEWIGVDSGVCAGSAGSVLRYDDALSAMTRRRGVRVAVALPVDAVYFEKIDLPAVGRRDAAKLVEGQLDLKLPVPVEKCVVRKCPVGTKGGSSFLAFATPTDELDARLAKSRDELGCEPEAMYPIVEILWRAYGTDHPEMASPAIVVNAGSGEWTLLAIDNGVPAGSIQVAHGDVASATKSARILAMRLSSRKVRVVLYGSCADDSVASAFDSAMDVRSERPADYVSRVAMVLARAGAESGGDCGFRCGEYAHPVAGRRRCLQLFALGAVPMAVALAMLVASLGKYVASASRNAMLVAKCDEYSAMVADERLPQRGRAAVERAKTLYDWRNPTVVAFSRKVPVDALPYACRLAADAGMTFSSVSYDGQSLRLNVRSASDKALQAWRSDVESTGFEFDSEPLDNGTAIVTIRSAEVAQ